MPTVQLNQALEDLLGEIEAKGLADNSHFANLLAQRQHKKPIAGLQRSRTAPPATDQAAAPISAAALKAQYEEAKLRVVAAEAAKARAQEALKSSTKVTTSSDKKKPSKEQKRTANALSALLAAAEPAKPAASGSHPKQATVKKPGRFSALFTNIAFNMNVSARPWEAKTDEERAIDAARHTIAQHKSSEDRQIRALRVLVNEIRARGGSDVDVLEILKKYQDQRISAEEARKLLSALEIKEGAKKEEKEISLEEEETLVLLELKEKRLKLAKLHYLRQERARQEMEDMQKKIATLGLPARLQIYGGRQDPYRPSGFDYGYDGRTGAFDDQPLFEIDSEPFGDERDAELGQLERRFPNQAQTLDGRSGKANNQHLAGHALDALDDEAMMYTEADMFPDDPQARARVYGDLVDADPRTHSRFYDPRQQLKRAQTTGHMPQGLAGSSKLDFRIRPDDPRIKPGGPLFKADIYRAYKQQLFRDQQTAALAKKVEEDRLRKRELEHLNALQRRDQDLLHAQQQLAEKQKLAQDAQQIQEQALVAEQAKRNHRDQEAVRRELHEVRQQEKIRAREDCLADLLRLEELVRRHPSAAVPGIDISSLRASPAALRKVLLQVEDNVKRQNTAAAANERRSLTREEAEIRRREQLLAKEEQLNRLEDLLRAHPEAAVPGMDLVKLQTDPDAVRYALSQVETNLRRLGKQVAEQANLSNERAEIERRERLLEKEEDLVKLERLLAQHPHAAVQGLDPRHLPTDPSALAEVLRQVEANIRRQNHAQQRQAFSSDPGFLHEARPRMALSDEHRETVQAFLDSDYAKQERYLEHLRTRPARQHLLDAAMSMASAMQAQQLIDRYKRHGFRVEMPDHHQGVVPDIVVDSARSPPPTQDGPATAMSPGVPLRENALPPRSTLGVAGNAQYHEAAPPSPIPSIILQTPSTPQLPSSYRSPLGEPRTSASHPNGRMLADLLAEQHSDDFAEREAELERERREIAELEAEIARDEMTQAALHKQRNDEEAQAVLQAQQEAKLQAAKEIEDAARIQAELSSLKDPQSGGGWGDEPWPKLPTPPATFVASSPVLASAKGTPVSLKAGTVDDELLRGNSTPAVQADEVNSASSSAPKGPSLTSPQPDLWAEPTKVDTPAGQATPTNNDSSPPTRVTPSLQKSPSPPLLPAIGSRVQSPVIKSSPLSQSKVPHASDEPLVDGWGSPHASPTASLRKGSERFGRSDASGRSPAARKDSENSPQSGATPLVAASPTGSHQQTPRATLTEAALGSPVPVSHPAPAKVASPKMSPQSEDKHSASARPSPSLSTAATPRPVALSSPPALVKSPSAKSRSSRAGTPASANRTPIQESPVSGWGEPVVESPLKSPVRSPPPQQPPGTGWGAISPVESTRSLPAKPPSSSLRSARRTPRESPAAPAAAWASTEDLPVERVASIAATPQVSAGSLGSPGQPAIRSPIHEEPTAPGWGIASPAQSPGTPLAPGAWGQVAEAGITFSPKVAQNTPDVASPVRSVASRVQSHASQRGKHGSPAFGLNDSRSGGESEDTSASRSLAEHPTTAVKGSDPVVVSMAAPVTPHSPPVHQPVHAGLDQDPPEDSERSPEGDAEVYNDEADFDGSELHGIPVFMHGEPLEPGMSIAADPPPHPVREAYPKNGPNVTVNAVIDYFSQIAAEHGYDALVDCACEDQGDYVIFQGYFVRLLQEVAPHLSRDGGPDIQTDEKGKGKATYVTEASETGWS